MAWRGTLNTIGDDAGEAPYLADGLPDMMLNKEGSTRDGGLFRRHSTICHPSQGGGSSCTAFSVHTLRPKV